MSARLQREIGELRDELAGLASRLEITESCAIATRPAIPIMLNPEVRTRVERIEQRQDEHERMVRMSIAALLELTDKLFGLIENVALGSDD